MKFLSQLLFLSLFLLCSACISNPREMRSPVPEPVAASAPSQSYIEPSGGGSPDYYGPVGEGENYEEIAISGTRRIPHSTNAPASKPVPIQKQSPGVFSINDVVSQLSDSAFGYSVPQEANIDDDITVVVKINPSISIDEIKSHLPEGQQHSQNIQITRIVEVKVETRDFDVTEITPSRQLVMGDRDTTWTWSLKPLSSGPNKEVKITVTAIVTVDGEKVERYLDTYTGTVKVNITTKQRISKWLSANWEWAWGSLLIPIAGYIWSIRSKKKKAKK